MNRAKVVAVVQARMGSTRLPNKAMLYLEGYPIVGWIYFRLKKSIKIDAIVFALPDNRQSLLIASYLDKIGAKYTFGSEEDVLDRVVNAAEICEATTVVRICADNPCISATEVDHLINYYFNSKFDYCYNHIPRNNLYPDGLGAEVSSIDILRNINNLSLLNEEREHIYNFIIKNPNYYSIGTCNPINEKLQQPHIKLDLDTYEDYLNLMKWNLDINDSAEVIIDKITRRRNAGQ